MAKTNPGGSSKSPLLRIAKREDIPRWKAWLIRLIAVVLALAVDGLIIFAIVKLNPVEVYQAMFSGAFGLSLIHIYRRPEPRRFYGAWADSGSRWPQ